MDFNVQILMCILLLFAKYKKVRRKNNTLLVKWKISLLLLLLFNILEKYNFLCGLTIGMKIQSW